MPLKRVGPSPLAADPIVATAIAEHGRDPSEAIWRDMENGPETGFPATEGRPNIHVDGNYAYVRWWQADGRTPMYEVTSDRRVIRMPRREMPETVKATLIGRPLADLIHIPGDTGLVIHDIHEERLGEYRVSNTEASWTQSRTS